MSAQPLTEVEHFLGAVGDRLDGSPLAIMMDIDGTLSPIAPTPSEAIVPEDTRLVLRRLAGLPQVIVALVSGRSADDAWRLAGVEGAWVIGNHGIETRTPHGDIAVNETVRDYESAIAEASRRLRALEVSAPGALVENKRWTMSLHYRLVAPEDVPALIRRAREVADDLGLRVIEGRKIVEIRPPMRVDKGTATVAFAERHGAFADGASVVYAGDDRTDEDAFRELRARNARAVTVRILSSDDQVNTETAAEYVLASPRALLQLLQWCVARRAPATAAD